MSFYLIPGANSPIELEIGGEGTTLPAANKIKVSLVANGVEVVKTGADLTVSGNTVTVSLTQAESLMFIGKRQGRIQVNWLDSSIRYPTLVENFGIGEQLLPEVMS